MRRFFTITFVVAFAGPVTACRTVEHVGRPPSAVEIARINDAIASGRNATVEASVGLAGYPVQEPSCAGGGCGARVEPLRVCVDGTCEAALRDASRIKDPPRAITFVDDHQMAFDTRRGGTLVLPLDLVTGVKVSGTDRSLGAAIGLGIGGFVDLGVGSIVYVGRRLVTTGDGGNSAAPCTATCDAEIALAMLPALVVGALVGHALGVPHHFVFGDGAAAP